MNKKRLSVVMAGAMLASSVAPIMAAEEVSVTEIQKGNLINEITDLLWDAPKFSNDYRVDSTRRNKSVYTVKINGAENSDIYDLTVSGDNAVLKSALQKKVQEEINKLAVGAKVELVDLGSQKVTEGNNELILSKEKTTKYTAAELENTGDFKDNGSVEDEIKNSNAGNSNAATVKIIKKHGHVAGKGYVIELTEEAAKTAEFFGSNVIRLYDVGVSGIHRLLSKLDIIQSANCVIAVAGMEGALAGVLGGLVNKPVIAVPTSIGYGANMKGLSALLTMINSCSNGIAVVNIDNGFGAGYIATQINRLGEGR